MDCEIDLRPGGEFRTVLRSPEGQDFPMMGYFLEVIQNEKLVWTDALTAGYRPSVNPFLRRLLLLSRTGKERSIRFLPFIKMKLAEKSMRIWGSTKDGPSMMIGGQIIAPQSVLILCPLATHRNPELFQKPNEFNPSRTYPDHRFAYYPFGGGARKCIGEYLALLEMKALLSAMLQRFRFEWTDKSSLHLASATTLWPQQAWIRIRKRKSQ